MNDRGVSPVFGYALTLGIATLLIVGLVMSAGGHVESQREQVTETELQVIGGHVAADIAAADRMNRTRGTSEINITRDLQPFVVGSTYTIAVKHDPARPYDGPTEYYLVLNTTRTDVTVQVGIATETHVRPATVDGGSIEIVLDGNSLVIRNA